MSFQVYYIGESWHVMPIIHSSESSDGVRGGKKHDICGRLYWPSFSRHVHSIGGYRSGARDAMPPPPSLIFFQFHEVFGPEWPK